tara:strand:- start:116 stop:439 length:324 start_codon:yes stop_codon:yes gene_type:complete
MSDRFDFEQQIQKCWLITDDLYDLSEAVLERDLSHDTITNVLFGLKEIYEIRFNTLWELFEDVHMNLVRENKMLNEECAALREQLSDAYDGQGYGIAAIKPKKKDKK